MDDVQRVLHNLSQLLAQEIEALPTGSESLILGIDREIDRTFGEKERAMGALQQHKREHGCD